MALFEAAEQEGTHAAHKTNEAVQHVVNYQYLLQVAYRADLGISQTSSHLSTFVRGCIKN